MLLNGVLIEDTFAEAFTMRVARLLITARTPRWAKEAALKLTGFATSVIGNAITVEDETRKLRTIAETAKSVWG